jgi:protein tyrosine phosphatase (PTP) superfamily phosphohydrolase (DUF442 family)
VPHIPTRVSVHAVCPTPAGAAVDRSRCAAREERKLTEQEFRDLTTRIVNEATKNNTPVSDALAATAKAMGLMICILAERPGVSADELVAFAQNAVAEFTREAMLYCQNSGAR